MSSALRFHVDDRFRAAAEHFSVRQICLMAHWRERDGQMKIFPSNA